MKQTSPIVAPPRPRQQGVHGLHCNYNRVVGDDGQGAAGAVGANGMAADMTPFRPPGVTLINGHTVSGCDTSGGWRVIRLPQCSTAQRS